MTSRTVRAIFRAERDDIGDLRTQRPLPNAEIEQIDPFLFLNHHGPQIYPPGNRGLPFGPHPHRGFETVTFILEGSLMHRDSGGHESVIESGGVQWMTAGRGLEHAELSPPEFLERGGALEILQLWVNLPAKLKMTDPRYIGLQRAEIPTHELDDGNATLHLMSGEWNGKPGPVPPLAGVMMTMLEMKGGATVTLPAPADRNVFFYVVRGTVDLSGTIVGEFHLAQLNDDGDTLEITAATDAYILFGLAKPFGEPVVAHGPFVMNTRAEIMQALRDYQSGLFGGIGE